MTKFTEHTDREESTASTPTSSGYLRAALQRAFGAPQPDVTAFFADGGETFALEGSSEREWLTADASSVMEVIR